MVGKGNSWFSF
uniref:Uncharacterized protein n=1 Tax=Anguilla anguilla TaxID=7936 RepID=A0A0E9V0W6_ANGAN